MDGNSGDIAMSTNPDDSGSTETPLNVLLLAPSVGSHEDEVCGELLHGPGERDRALLVTCMESPAERLDVWTDHEDGRPGDATVIDVEAAARSTAATPSGTDGPPNAVVESVDPETDLVGLGDVIDRHLAALVSEGETTLCVHSVSDLLQRAEERAVFKFLEVLTSTVERAGVVAHYHMNPDVHDPETIETFEVLFDSVVDLRTANVAGE
ncbi:hypothetical protein C475_07025 [Halosimplex carlsbadense 2-9-1]|uniref:KaiC-like domain-containing protein n=2 Tax=Halosimplex carlsbadense TaxID=171164 RepID=M0CYE7_9EURY|nr:hypothetical protein C475_07025 [Halosimplex carlsbadense 2-9-1]